MLKVSANNTSRIGDFVWQTDLVQTYVEAAGNFSREELKEVSNSPTVPAPLSRNATIHAYQFSCTVRFNRWRCLQYGETFVKYDVNKSGDLDRFELNKMYEVSLRPKPNDDN